MAVYVHLELAVFMARAGLFDDLDAMLHWHPMDGARVGKVHMAAAQHMYIELNK